MKSFLIVSTVFIVTLMPWSVLATETVPPKKAPLVIESQVKGSQEQPNVIYIMPWQGIENPIKIEDGKQKVVLPHFKPINPKSFKKQATRFYNVKLSKQKQSKEQ